MAAWLCPHLHAPRTGLSRSAPRRRLHTPRDSPQIRSCRPAACRCERDGGVRSDRLSTRAARRPWPSQPARRRHCPLSLMSAVDVTPHRLGSLASLACLRLAFGFLALLDGVRRPLATVQVAPRRTDHRQPPAPSALLRERSTPGLRTSHVSHPRSQPSCGPLQNCRVHVLCGRRTAPRSGARRPKQVAWGRTLSNCVGASQCRVQGRSPALTSGPLMGGSRLVVSPERR